MMNRNRMPRQPLPPAGNDSTNQPEAVLWDEHYGTVATHCLIFKHGAIGRLYYVGQPSTETIQALCKRTGAMNATLYVWNDDDRDWVTVS